MSAYHPESQGALERFHQTLQNMMRAYCIEHGNDWDQGIHLLLFAMREAAQESLGFSPFELIFGRTVRGPLKLLKESWLADHTPDNLLDQVADLRYRLLRANELARKNLEKSQQKMKTWYDRKARKRSFRIGDKVLILLPIPQQSLRARYCGPYLITRKVSDLDYVIDTPYRRKSQRLCHINMLKEYQERTSTSATVAEQSLVTPSCVIQDLNLNSSEREVGEDMTDSVMVLKNSDVLSNLKGKLHHLSDSEQDEMTQLVLDFTELFPDIPSRTECVFHDVDVGDAMPIKQHPYHVNPIKLQFFEEGNRVHVTAWNHRTQSKCPCILVPKKDGTYRFCIDFRKVNLVTKTDSFPIPKVEDYIQDWLC